MTLSGRLVLIIVRDFLSNFGYVPIFIYITVYVCSLYIVCDH